MNGISISRIGEEINRVDSFLQQLTMDLSLTAGSITCIAWEAIFNWLPELNNLRWENLNQTEIEQLMMWIKRNSDEYVKKQIWKKSDEKLNEAIEEACRQANLEGGNMLLNKVLAQVWFEILIETAKKTDNNEEIKILDIGGGTGDTTHAMLNQLEYDISGIGQTLAGRCHFYILEPSFLRINKASAKIADKDGRRYIIKDIKYTAITDDDSYLGDDKPNKYHIIVSNAVFHHHPVPSYLADIHRVLKNSHALIVGDWHPTTAYHPAIALQLFKAVGLDEKGEKEFMKFFKIDESTYKLIHEERPPEEKEKDRQMVEYVRARAAIIKRKKEEHRKAKEEGSSVEDWNFRDVILEAHRSNESFKSQLNAYGFETDLSRTRFKRCRISNEGVVNPLVCIEPKFACITVGIKKK